MASGATGRAFANLLGYDELRDKFASFQTKKRGWLLKLSYSTAYSAPLSWTAHRVIRRERRLQLLGENCTKVVIACDVCIFHHRGDVIRDEEPVCPERIPGGRLDMRYRYQEMEVQ